jgi:ATP citrate (pro-S)-lyase
MSAKSVREYHGKKLLARHLEDIDDRMCLVTQDTDLDTLSEANPWLLDTSLVVKPDQLIKRRGKLGLVGVRLRYEEVKEWVNQRMNTSITVDSVTGSLDTFIIEPFVEHQEEYYVCIQSQREGDEILFCSEGGIDVGDVDSKAERLFVSIQQDMPTRKQTIVEALLQHVSNKEHQEKLGLFLSQLLEVYRKLNFTYLEINPIVFNKNGKPIPLDLAAKLDETASFLTGWGHVDFRKRYYNLTSVAIAALIVNLAHSVYPALFLSITAAPFGRKPFAEEEYIRELDSKTGASLKLTILNPAGRIWTMVAGGGASVVYADTITDLGLGHELANYGEYSGAPSTEATYEYAKTLIGLLCREKDPRGKILIIGGAIANFTDVAATFTGLIQAIEAYQEDIKRNHVTIWVRRAGPNYQEGLKLMRECANQTGLRIHIYGPETHVTAVVPLALGLAKLEDFPEFDHEMSPERNAKRSKSSDGSDLDNKPSAAFTGQVADHEADHAIENFTAKTRCVVYGLQHQAVQGMLDFDNMCKREKPSVAAMIFPFSANHFVKFYWGTDEILMPVYQTMSEALTKHAGKKRAQNSFAGRTIASKLCWITHSLRFYCLLPYRGNCDCQLCIFSLCV